MADVSHELRTPLAIVKGELEAIEDGVRPLSRDSLPPNHEVAALASWWMIYMLALRTSELAYARSASRSRSSCRRRGIWRAVQ